MSILSFFFPSLIRFLVLSEIFSECKPKNASETEMKKFSAPCFASHRTTVQKRQSEHIKTNNAAMCS